jgi:hypothetical protein
MYQSASKSPKIDRTDVKHGFSRFAKLEANGALIR